MYDGRSLQRGRAHERRRGEVVFARARWRPNARAHGCENVLPRRAEHRRVVPHGKYDRRCERPLPTPRLHDERSTHQRFRTSRDLMSAPSHVHDKHSGAALIVSLIMLTLITLLVTTAFQLSNTSMMSVGNMQTRDEAVAA